MSTEATPGSGMSPQASSLKNGMVPAVYKMRCPKCRKLYSVQGEVMRAATLPLKFQCADCQTQFGAKLLSPELSTELLTTGANSESPDMIETFVIEAPAAPAVIREALSEQPQTSRTPSQPVPTTQSIAELRCPKCGSRNSLSASECRYCGVVFAKMRSEPAPPPEGFVALDSAMSSRKELNELWEKVLANYEDENIHQKFIDACFETKSLAFASQKYARILSASPNEEMARAMRKRILALASFKVGSNLKASSQKDFQFDDADEVVRPRVRLPSLNNMAILIGTIVMVLGLVIPNMKQLAGVGFAAILLAIGMRFFARPQE